LLILVAISAIGPLSLNILVPSMPGIQRGFQADPATVQLTLTLYLIGMAGCQLFYGPLSDRFGRRPVLLGGLCLYVLACIAAAAAPTIEVLIVARLAQAIGGTAGIVLSRAIVRDLYGRDQAASVIGYISVAWAVAPMLAPSIGGLLETLGSWRYSFLLLIGLGTIVLLACVRWLHETNHHRAEGGGLAPLLEGYRWLVRRRRFWLYTMTLGFSSSVFFSFLGGAPYLMVEVMGRSPLEYGVWFIIVSLGWMGGNFLSGRYSQRLGVDHLLLAGSLLAALAALVGLLLGSTGDLQPWMIFTPMTFAANGQRHDHAQRLRGGGQPQPPDRGGRGRLGRLPADRRRRRGDPGGRHPAALRDPGDVLDDGDLRSPGHAVPAREQPAARARAGRRGRRGAAGRIGAVAAPATAARTGHAKTRPRKRPRRRRVDGEERRRPAAAPFRPGLEAFALQALAQQLAMPAHGLGALALALLGRLLEVAAQLHLTEDAFALQLLLERAHCLVDVVVANGNLHGRSDLLVFAGALAVLDKKYPRALLPARQASLCYHRRPAL
jgi:DHA1 family bicyclomycin/chloramphenicol resistance-like MFS transporter